MSRKPAKDIISLPTISEQIVAKVQENLKNIETQFSKHDINLKPYKDISSHNYTATSQSYVANSGSNSVKKAIKFDFEFTESLHDRQVR